MTQELSRVKPKPVERNAGPFARLQAQALDLLVVAGWLGFAGAVGVVARATGFEFDSAVRNDIFAFTTLVAPVVATFAWQEASGHQATFGKRRVGLRVTDLAGERLNIGRALGRSAAKFLPWQIAHTAVFGLIADSASTGFIVLAITAQGLVVASVIAMAIDPRHRAFHDWAAGTRVTATISEGSRFDYSRKEGTLP